MHGSPFSNHTACLFRFYDDCPKFNSDVENNINTFAGTYKTVLWIRNDLFRIRIQLRICGVPRLYVELEIL